jgi:hypothetical protein
MTSYSKNSSIFEKTFREFYQKEYFESLPKVQNATDEEVIDAVNKLCILSWVRKTSYLNGNVSYEITKLGKEKFAFYYKLSLGDALLGYFCHYVSRF